MFRICCGERTEHVVSVVVEDSRPIESSPRSGKSIDSPAVTPEKEEKTPWWYKLFGRMPSQQKKEQNVDNDQTNNTKNTKKKPKMPLWFSKRRCQVSPAQEENTPKKQCLHTLIQKKVKGLVVPKEEVDTKTEEDKKVIQDPKEAASTNIIGKHRRLEQFRNLGFPNPAQNCYMNACLQSLLTMEDFVNSINSQEQVWRSIPEAQLLRSFMEVKKSYFSQDKRMKVKLLTAFKTAVSVHAPEFRDFSQKDAHEFLTSVLEQVRSFTPKLRLMATSMGKTYKCPVESNTMFKMENTRTCKGCGAKSIREEVFTSLSLDLIPGHGTLEEMLINYLKQTDLEYQCKCGSILSGQRSSFTTLPNVLVLHLKRFSFTPTYRLIKVCDPVHLNRDLVVSSNEPFQGGCCYSLVSVINHMGTTAERGHYICDGIDPDVKPEDPTDRWFTYDDALVTKTSGASVCNNRQKSAYVLFYKKIC
ncbi:ubiquitin carboxyl-terminal hydrolase 37-like isoform X1 [Notolabrus celidotus]|uniref:ubiquitin carboxyl-terminal hydrolase 37-like isoform X1 n=1 Tax=Notolabrus celidotus TaxID=1203425 RepID=UPI00148FAB35|nr:ubiquitin carboxyl-terminal hydrolase 37-like isoform X1 [Notolabrus celidotus]XP_034554810.1 ubiquitin carboxyl-terminal hydrolase 37-like isoform X1 [Notolabrus celidotus]